MKVSSGTGDLELQQVVDRLIRRQLAAGEMLRVTAEGSSMRSLIRPGDALFIGGVDPREVRCGDVIAVRRRRALQLHRVTSIRLTSGARSFLTQGDFTLLPDGWTSEDSLIGRLVAFERDGRRRDLSSRAKRLTGILSARCSRMARRALAWRSAARELVVSTHTHAPFRQLYRVLYELAARTLRAGPGGAPQVQALYIRGSFAGHDWVPGVSDIDLAVVADAAPAIRAACWQRYERAKRVFPFIGEMWILSPDELEAWRRYDPRRGESVQWRVLKGSPLSPAGAPAQPLMVVLDLLLEIESRLALLARPFTGWMRDRAPTRADRIGLTRTFRRIDVNARQLAAALAPARHVTSSTGGADRFAIFDDPQQLPRALVEIFSRVGAPLVHAEALLEQAGLRPDPAPESVERVLTGELRYRQIDEDASSVHRVVTALDVSASDLEHMKNDEALGPLNDIDSVLPVRADLWRWFRLNRLETIATHVSDTGVDASLLELLLKRFATRLLVLLSRASNIHTRRPFTTSDHGEDDRSELTKQICSVSELATALGQRTGRPLQAAARQRLDADDAPQDPIEWLDAWEPRLRAKLHSVVSGSPFTTRS